MICHLSHSKLHRARFGAGLSRKVHAKEAQLELLSGASTVRMPWWDFGNQNMAGRSIIYVYDTTIYCVYIYICDMYIYIYDMYIYTWYVYMW